MNRAAAALLLACAIGASGHTASAQSLHVIHLPANDLYYNPVDSLLYASVPSSAGSRGNSIIRIDPVAHKIGAHVFVGSEPGPMAASDDGQYLYVGLTGAGAVCRYNLQTQQAEFQFTLGNDPTNGPYEPLALAVAPGQSHTVAVSTAAGYDFPIAIYDDGSARPSDYLVPADQGCYSLAFAPGATSLYATVPDLAGANTALASIPVLASGLGGAAALGSFDYLMTYDPASGLAIGTEGTIAEPAIPRQLGRLGYAAPYAGFRIIATTPDTAHHRVYAVALTEYYSSLVLVEYDLNTMLPIGSWVLPGTMAQVNNPASSLSMCGPDALAFISGSQIDIVQGLNLPEIVSFTLDDSTVAAGGSLQGTLTLSRPAPAGGISVVISSNVAIDGAFSGLSLPIVAGQRTGHFSSQPPAPTSSVTAQVTAQYGIQTLAEPLTLLDAHGDPALPGYMTVVDLSTSGIAYDPADDRLYVTVPDSDTLNGNQLVRISPVTGKIDGHIYLGSAPDVLAVADGGQYLYAGLDGSNTLCRVNLALGRVDRRTLLDPAFFGRSYVFALAPLPMRPESVAVAAASEYLPATAGLAVYDDGVARPGAYGNDQLVGYLAAGAKPSSLYVVTASWSENGTLNTLALGAAGITQVNSSVALLKASAPIHFDSGRIYSDDGQVVDAHTSTLAGTLSLPPRAVAPDAANGKVYAVAFTKSTAYPSLCVFDSNTFLVRDALPLPGITGAPSDLVLAGPHRVAFRTQGQVIIVNLAP